MSTMSSTTPPARNMSSMDIPVPFSWIDRVRMTARCRDIHSAGSGKPRCHADFLLFGVRLSSPRRRAVRSLVQVMLLASLGAPADAMEGLAKQTGTRLLQTCGAAQARLAGRALSAEASADAALCLGFLEGFAWGHGWAAWRKGEDMYFCPPEKFSYRDAVPAVLDYLAAHPQRMDTDAHILVFSALSAAFPCTP